jgi:ATP-dependent 26S proteasome regulatory subunit
MWLGAKVFQRTLNPPPPGAAAARARLAKILGISQRKLRLNEYEMVLCPDLYHPSQLNVSLSDVGGLETLVKRIQDDLAFVKAFEGMPGDSMLAASKGLLLYGPPGTGKTFLAKVCKASWQCKVQSKAAHR